MNNFSCEFIKLEIDNHFQDFNKRVEYFKNKVTNYFNSRFFKIWTKIYDNKNISKTVIYTNNYFDFVKLR